MPQLSPSTLSLIPSVRSMSVRSMSGWFFLAAVAAFSFPAPIVGQTEGDYLYNVTMVRAAPGHYAEFISAIEESFAVHEEAGDQAPLWMRHSQGDQWDFMLIYPMGDNESYYSAPRVGQRASVWGSARGRALATKIEAITSYSEEWFARSISLEEMTARFDGMGFYHVEMFAGLPGLREELLEQRRMENRYYEHLNRQLNVLFVREGGSNWDAMTIGFYESLQDYAVAGAGSTAADQESAANAAGFDGVGNISPLLRSLLSYHHDTLAVRVR